MTRSTRVVGTALAAAALVLGAASCGGSNDPFQASANFGSCGSGGTRITLFMTSNEVVTVDVRIEDGLLEGQLSRSNVEVDAMSVEIPSGGLCACTCAPGEPLGTVIIESDGEVIETLDLGPAPDRCCESGP